MGELSDGPEHAASSGGGNALVLWQPPQAYAEAAAGPAPSRAFARAGLQRAGRAAKLALMIWGGVSLTAAGAYAVGHVLSAPVQLKAEATAEPPQSAAVRGNAAGNAAADAAPARAQAKPRVVAIGEPEAAPAKPSAKPTPNTIAARPAGPAAESPARRLQPLTNAADVGEAGSGFTRKPEVRVRGEVAQRRVSPADLAAEEFGPGPDEPVVAARVPRPRPDDFVVRPRREPTITGSIEERWEEIRRPRRWDRRFTTWRDGEGRRFQRLPRYIIVR